MPSEKSKKLREQAEICRRLARQSDDFEIARRLLELAKDLEEQADLEDKKAS